MEWGTLAGGDWTSPRIFVADTFLRRWLGLRPRPGGMGILIAGRSVHGLGMKEPLVVVGLDARGCVIGTGNLLPRRIMWFKGAAQILELPSGQEPPPEGAVLSWVRGGTVDSDRKSVV